MIIVGWLCVWYTTLLHTTGPQGNVDTLIAFVSCWCSCVVLKPELEMDALLAMPATSAPQELYEVQMNMFDCVMALSCVKKDLWVARILQLFTVSRSSGISPVDKTLFIISVSKQSMRRTVANKCNESRHKFGCIAYFTNGTHITQKVSTQCQCNGNERNPIWSPHIPIIIFFTFRTMAVLNCMNKQKKINMPATKNTASQDMCPCSAFVMEYISFWIGKRARLQFHCMYNENTLSQSPVCFLSRTASAYERVVVVCRCRVDRCLPLRRCDSYMCTIWPECIVFENVHFLQGTHAHWALHAMETQHRERCPWCGECSLVRQTRGAQPIPIWIWRVSATTKYTYNVMVMDECFCM